MHTTNAVSTIPRIMSMKETIRSPLRQIGEIAEIVGLSLRTVRFYEEAGLVVPAQRTRGGFRLYDDDSVDRFRLIMQMKPLGFALEEMRILIDTRAALALEAPGSARFNELRERLSMFLATAGQKVFSLREQLGVAEGFVNQLAQELAASGAHDQAN